MVGVGRVEEEGPLVSPLSLLMLSLLKLIPDGKRAPVCPDPATFAQAHNGRYYETLTELLDSLAECKIKPLVVERFPLAEAAQAHELLERGGYAGKVVLVTSDYSRSANTGR